MTAGPAKENNCALEFLNGHQMLGRRELKRNYGLDERRLRNVD